MTSIGIGIIGGGYMGKAHAVAMSSVGAIFNTDLRPKLQMVAATSDESAARYAKAYGFAESTGDWRKLVNNPKVEAIIIASVQATHREIAEAAFALGKPVMCEKPLGASLEDARAMVNAAEGAGAVNMVGFNYIRTPASQYARKLIADGEIGDLVYFRGEHTEDFFADASLPANWRTDGRANGCMGDLAPHMINGAMALAGPITKVQAQIQTVHPDRKGGVVNNDDQAQMMCEFENGCMGHLFFSRVAHGRKMGYIYEITGITGAIRFDGEDQNAIWLYKAEGDQAQRGFVKILTGPEHPDYLPFCQGPGHGTGYQDQIIIEAKDFLEAIANGAPKWPTFRDGLAVSKVVEAAFDAHDSGTWAAVEAY